MPGLVQSQDGGRGGQSVLQAANVEYAPVPFPGSWQFPGLTQSQDSAGQATLQAAKVECVPEPFPGSTQFPGPRQFQEGA